MISCHSHSGMYCNHGYGKLQDCVNRAVELGFKVFCLTEHMPRYRELDLYANEIEMNLKPLDTMKQFEAFYNEAKLIQQNTKGCHIIVGMEIEWIYENTIHELRDLLSRFPCDMLVGSVQYFY